MVRPRPSRRIFLAVAASSTLAGCITERHFGLSPLAAATSVEVRAADRGVKTPGNSLKLVTTITDARQVAALVAFCNARLDGWYVPIAGGPIPPVAAHYFEGARFVEHLGAGPGFFSRGIEDTRRATSHELAEFLSLLGLDQAALRFP